MTRLLPISARALLLVALLGAFSIGASCGSAPRDNSLLTSDFEEVFGVAGSGGEGAGASPGWTILLTAYSGEDAADRAREAAALIRAETGLTDLYVDQRPQRASVTHGRYTGPDDRQGQRDLARIRALRIGGNQPFASAFFSPPRSGAQGGHPELALSRVKQEWGASALYTLQVGVYESRDRSEAMRAAEQGALQLRRQGEMAFYHHGPTRSMVTIGVFTARDYDLTTGEMSPAIIELRKRHPNNLFNGMGVRERGSLGERMQPSGLVLIPD
jgi:hypothetical protein